MLSIEGRLLCAATQAYSLRATGPAPSILPPPNPSRSERVGYTVTPVGEVAGLDLIDAGLVGASADGVIVAFRGTLPPKTPDHGQTLLDWANDADAPLIAAEGFPGLVHQGFLDSLNNLWPTLEPLIVAGWAANPVLPVYVTGHSKGGALAHLAAMRIHAQLPTAHVVVRTFAAARCGDQAFAAAYAAAITDSVRYEYADDIVPHLPPSEAMLRLLQTVPILGPRLEGLTTGFRSVGTLRYITAAGEIQPDSSDLEAARLSSLIGKLATFQFKAIGNDHTIDPGSGYSEAICPGI